MGRQTQLDFGFGNNQESSDVPFVNEVEIFNSTFGKPNNYETTIPEIATGATERTLTEKYG